MVVPKEVSTYMQTLTRYLSNIMNSVLLGLPAEIKELIYFDALSHTCAMMLVSGRRTGRQCRSTTSLSKVFGAAIAAILWGHD